tara:strand:- start:3844 stop:4041 length:198 start_codon:yes stop_codon:yes gene_type:complete
MKNVEETYDIMPSIIKEHAGMPNSYRDLTNDQERFIIEMFQIDREAVKATLLETVEEMKELVNDI